MQLEITGVSPAYHQLCQGHTGMIRLATRVGPGGAHGDSESDSEFAGHGISYPIIGGARSLAGPDDCRSDMYHFSLSASATRSPAEAGRAY